MEVPLRAKLVGQSFVVFRDTNGKVGVLVSFRRRRYTGVACIASRRLETMSCQTSSGPRSVSLATMSVMSSHIGPRG
jgi:hypothetical protein